MSRLAFLALAATAAFLPAAASAQVSGGSGAFHGGMPGGTVVHGGTHFQRGFFIPPMWFGPQFHVQNWQAYGLAQPAPGHRWVRYYNDAYMIDPYGRVADRREGLDWDQRGEQWSDEGGIPHYEGRGDWRPGEQDYAWFRQHGYGQGCAPGYGGGCAPGYAGHGGHGGYGNYGYGYGGWGVAYPMIIETTTTTGGCGCSCDCGYEVVEEVVEVRRPRSRPHHRPRRVAPPPRPRPPAGERG
jgi:hypothetical protein